MVKSPTQQDMPRSHVQAIEPHCCYRLTQRSIFYGASDRSKVTQNKINFAKNCLQWGLNSQPLDHQSHALPTELSHYLVVGVNH